MDSLIAFTDNPDQALSGSSTLLQRYQRQFVILLLGMSLFLVISVTYVIFKQQTAYLQSAFFQKCSSMLERVCAMSLEAVSLEQIDPKVRLSALYQSMRELEDAEPDVEEVAFFNESGILVIATVRDYAYQIPAREVKSVVSKYDFQKNGSHIFMSPVRNTKGKIVGTALIKASRYQLDTSPLRSAGIMGGTIILVFMVIGWLLDYYITRVKTLAQREAETTQELSRAYSELKDVQFQLVQAEKMSALGKLASTVGHELRNPLGAIKNAIYYIRDSLKTSNAHEQDPALAEFMDLIDREIKSSVRIIGDIMEYSKLVKIKPERVNVNKLVSYFKSTLEVPAHIQIVEDLDPSLPEALIDAERMQQVFVNIATNAILAMPEKGTLTIRTHIEEVDEQSQPGLKNSLSKQTRPWVYVHFIDTGCGMDPETLGKIFEPLFTTRAKGTGLGLPISLGIIRAHNGNIAVTSEKGKGSHFIVQFPLEGSYHDNTINR